MYYKMKITNNYLRYLFFKMCTFLLSVVTISCTTTTDENDYSKGSSDIDETALDYPVRVLVLGNSFSDDGTAYLDDLVNAAKLDRAKIGIYNGVIGGGGLKEWIEVYEKNIVMSYQLMAGAMTMNSKGTLSDVLSQMWDVIVFLHTSSKTYNWNSFEGQIDEILAFIRNCCPNPDLRIAYAMPWSHTVVSTPRELEGNITCARKLASDYGVEIIPVGIAVQNARNTTLCDENYLTRDNWHLTYGIGRYVAACTWFEKLLAPPSHSSVVGNAAIHSITSKEGAAGFKGSVPVDDSNRLLCQLCAFYAVRDTFTVTTIIP